MARVRGGVLGEEVAGAEGAGQERRQRAPLGRAAVGGIGGHQDGDPGGAADLL